MQSFMDKESKPSFNFPGLQDRSQPAQSAAKAAEGVQGAQAEPVKRGRKPAAAPVAAATPGTKKLVIGKPKY